MPKPTTAANAAPMPITTRRAFLKAGGALGTVAALAVPVAVLPKAEAAEHPDAELLRLGAEFERNLVLLKAEMERNAPVRERYARAVERWRGDLNREPFDNFVKRRVVVEHDDAIDREDAFFNAMDAVTSVIRSTPARTLDGLAVKVRATAYDCHFSLSFDLPPDQIGWQEGCFLQLVREVERMAKEAANV
ncbi:twin-arginine translocation signal domain-containing protein [Xanthobacter versatilis]|uniref:twin-arginine translocation signal domain-containing protein n=1 Tax=Xanthobacter autotrophicus (strain ATCC BAA-1158 / Py2) TaxID=78245 RepID=UPI003726327B